MATVLYVSKPISPPFRDGSKNLVRSLATRLSRHDAQIMVPARGPEDGLAPLGGRSLARLPVYGMGPMGYAPRLRDNVPVLRHLALEREADVHHYVFAPNPRSGLPARMLRALRRKPTVHTLASAPADDAIFARALFADVNVALSRHTEARMLNAGVPPHRTRRIPAFVEPVAPLGDSPDALRRTLGLPSSGALLTFPGDLAVGSGADLVVDALALLEREDLIVAIAHRPKTVAAKEREGELRAQAKAAGVGERVHFVGETPKIHALLEASDVVALPASSLVGKTDQPLVLLEAMSLGRPVIVAEGSAAAELAEGGGAVLVTPAVEALAAELERLLSDGEAREALGEEARRAVRERFSPESAVRAYEALYDELEGISSGG